MGRDSPSSPPPGAGLRSSPAAPHLDLSGLQFNDSKGPDLNDEPHVLRGTRKNSPRNKIATPWAAHPQADLSAEEDAGAPTASLCAAGAPTPEVGQRGPVLLHVDSSRPAPVGVDRELHAALLQQLLGQQLQQLRQDTREVVREVVRAELRSALGGGKQAPEQAPEQAQARSSGEPGAPAKQQFGQGVEAPGKVAKPGERECRADDLDMDEMDTYEDPASLAELVSTAFDRTMPCVGRSAHWLQSLFGRLGLHDAPRRTDCASRLVDSASFTLAIYVAILANIVFMVYSADLQVSNYTSESEDGAEIVRTIEIAFLTIYSAEFALKLWRYRLYFFIDQHWAWNWLDTALLALSWYFVVLESALPNVSFLRMLRILKLAKVLRVFRLIAMFSELRAILNSLANTMGTLFWSIIMICVVLFMSGLTFTLIVGNYLSTVNTPGSMDGFEPIVDAFGSVWASFLTLFWCITGGDDWGQYYTILLPTGFLSVLLLMFFILFSQISVLSIILGIFVDRAMKSAAPTKDEAAVEHAVQEKHAARDLREILKRADVLGDGKISGEEWRAALKHAHVSSFCDLMGFRAADLLEFYKKMHREAPDGKVDLNEFMRGCLKLKGDASRFDMHVLHLEVQTVSDQLAKVTQELSKWSARGRS